MLSVTPLNGEATVILDNMQLKNVDLDIAINALMGSMLKHGCIDNIKNSILITVENPNTQKGTALQEKLTTEVNNLMHSNALNGAVISQTLSEDERLRTLSNEHGISIGKAAIVELVVAKGDRLRFADLAQLSITEITLLIDSRQTDLGEVKLSGHAGSGSVYI